MQKSVYVLVFDGLADWEPALALAALRDEGFAVQTVGFSRDIVTTTAGMRVVPDLAWEELSVPAISLLMLPGGDGWLRGEYPKVAFESTLRAVLEAQVPVAAICGATVALARAGVLESRPHTSNGERWLSGLVPDYPGKSLHRDALAVREGGLITAAGTAPVEFAREVLAELRAMPDDRLGHWFTMFKTGHLPDQVEPSQIFQA